MQSRHRRDAVTSRLRLRGHDYASPSNYFVTLCTENRACLFGDVRDGVMLHDTAGVVAESWWHSIPSRFPAVGVDEVVVMPNHIHGILMVGTTLDGHEVTDLPSLSTVVQWFKGVSTNDYILGVREFGWPRFSGRLWQKGYHEHIIRSDRELSRIRQYIEANASQWDQDENNPNQLGTS